MDINIKTKYSVGQEVYTIKSRQIVERCTVCDETGHIEYKGEKYHCPRCGGGKRIYPCGKLEYYVDNKYLIRSISIRTNGDTDLAITYNLAGFGGVMENGIFLTEKEAQTKCDERNQVVRNVI